MKRLLGLVVALLFCLSPLAAKAQGLLVVIDPQQKVGLPRPMVSPSATPQEGYKIRELAVQARISDQVARVNVSQSFVNTGSRPLEVSFLFPLPYDGAIDRLTLMVDGKERFPPSCCPRKTPGACMSRSSARIRIPRCSNGSGPGCFRRASFPCRPVPNGR